MNLSERNIRLVKDIISKLELKLNGLTVLVECANGAYSYTPIIALFAGADKVILCGKDTRYGKFEDNRSYIIQVAEKFSLDVDKLHFFKDRVPVELIKEIDIVTNTGQVRPITKEFIECLNPTSVIPLMWETWEFRSNDLDIKACQNNGIPVIGTNENYEKIKLFDYDGILAIKLLLDLGLEVHNNKIVIVGGGIVGHHIEKIFSKLNIFNIWITETGFERKQNCYSVHEIEKILKFESIDSIVFAELNYKDEIIGQTSKLSFAKLKTKFPDLRIGHISGNIDIEELKSSKIYYLPKNIRPIGYISFGLDEIGPRPVIELMAAGLKVGEIATRSRKEGASVEESILKTVKYGIGQDFENGFIHYKP